VLIQSFRKPISSWRPPPLHSHVGYRHQVHIRGSSAISSRVCRLSLRTSRTCSRSLQFGYRTSRTCSRSLQFGYRTSRTCSDQSSPHSNPTQSPCICFYGFSLDFGSRKGRYIFGQGTLFWIYAFISDFSKMWAIWIRI